MNFSEQRSTLKAVVPGAVISAVWALVLAVVIFMWVSPDFRRGGNSSNVDDELLSVSFILFCGAPLYALVGGVLGHFQLRKKRSLLFTWCVIPLTAILGSLAVGGSIYYIVTTVRTRIEDARQLDVAFVNYASSEIDGIDLYTDPRQRPGDTVRPGTDFQPYQNGVTEVSLYTIDRTLPWTANATVHISWWREVPAPCPHKTIKPPCVDSATFSAEAHLPHYSGTWNKNLVVIFLPQDKVRMEVIDRSHFGGKIALPPDDEYVVQGVRQKSSD
jgi:hypothetical protein